MKYWILIYEEEERNLNEIEQQLHQQGVLINSNEVLLTQDFRIDELISPIDQEQN